MNKITIIILFLLFGIQLNSNAQNVEDIRYGIEKYIKMEKETFLKEFIFNIEPNEEVRYSISLDNGTLYSWYAWLEKKNHLQVSLYDSNDKLLFRNIKSDRGFLRFTTKCTKSQVYHLIIKNISNKSIMTMATLTYNRKLKPHEINASAQNINENTYQELIDIVGYASNATYLKDFRINLEPNNESRYSVVLSKNTIYSLSFYQNEPNQFEVNLYSNKSEKPIAPSSKKITNKVTIFEYEINETGVYHLFVKNMANKEQKTCVLLSFVGKFKSKDSEKRTSQETKTETIVNDQEDIAKEENTNVYFTVEKMPKFKDKANKIKDFNGYVKKEMQYPQEALTKKIEGRVYVQFTVGENGYVKDAKVIRGSHPALDQEALRIVYSSPKWEPGTQRGIAVDVVFTFPIIFKLP